VQLGDFHSLDRLGHKLVLVVVKAEFVQLAGARLAQRQLITLVESQQQEWQLCSCGSGKTLSGFAAETEGSWVTQG
jgi:hypothetical protein